MKTYLSIKSVANSKQFFAIVSVALIAMMSVKASLTQKTLEQSFSTSFELVQE